MSPTRSMAEAFVSSLLAAASAEGYETSPWIIDHICYRTATQQEYRKVVTELSTPGSSLNGSVLSTATVNGRSITTFRLSRPLKVGEKLIESIEIPAPKPSQPYPTGFEHIEVIAADPIQKKEITFATGKVKFHYLPLSGLIAIEEKTRLSEWIDQTGLLQLLSRWDPIFSGSIPLGVDTDNSDLDILLHAKDLKGASAEILRTLLAAGIATNEWTTSHCRLGECMILKIPTGTTTIELFLSTEHTSKQDSHQDLLAEYQLIVRHGEPLRQKVREMKQAGLDTERAFVRALGRP